MRLAITDANIFIDLIKLDLLDYLFQIGLDIHTTISIIGELEDEQADLLLGYEENDQLTLLSLSAEQAEAVFEMKANKSFSDIDKTLLLFCRNQKMMMLSGEKLMRKWCKANQLEIHGIIWLFDKFLEYQLIQHEQAIEKMTFLLSFNTWLPMKECEKRLEKWKNLI